MKDKFPYFPHSSTTIEKKWDKELFGNKLIHEVLHPIVIEIEYHYPYYGLLDRKGKESHFLIDIVNLYLKVTEAANCDIGTK